MTARPALSRTIGFVLLADLLAIVQVVLGVLLLATKVSIVPAASGKPLPSQTWITPSGRRAAIYWSS